MNDMSAVIVPKSDQLNTDDLIAGPLTITITGVSIRPGTEQPVSISFRGDNSKPWKPCKSMSRILVVAWGPDASKYVGRSVTLYRDPSVKWAGMEVGGIRISHLSDIERPITMALTATRGSRKAHTVQAMPRPQESAPSLTEADYHSCAIAADLAKLEERRAATWKSLNAATQKALKAASEAAKARFTKPAQFDEAAAKLSLEQAGDKGSLEKAWAPILDHYASIDAEIPLELEATYKLQSEALA